MPDEIFEIKFIYPKLTVRSFFIQFIFGKFADQIFQDQVPLNCPLALSDVKSFYFCGSQLLSIWEMIPYYRPKSSD